MISEVVESDKADPTISFTTIKLNMSAEANNILLNTLGSAVSGAIWSVWMYGWLETAGYE